MYDRYILLVTSHMIIAVHYRTKLLVNVDEDISADDPSVVHTSCFRSVECWPILR